MKYPCFTDEQIWDWLGDREVFFCREPGDLFTNNVQAMKESFDILHHWDGILFYRLKRKGPNICDPLDCLDIVGNDVKFIGTHYEYDGPVIDTVDVIENWDSCSLEWFEKNKHDPNLHDKIQNCEYKQIY